MEYVYGAMLLHKLGKKVEEAALKKVLEAAGASVDDAKIKATVAALDGVDIDEASQKAAVAPVAAAPVAAAPAATEEKKEEKKEPAADAGAGLGALFG